MRCVNLDWLEVYCREPQECDAAFFLSHGFSDRVRLREYGTPQYKEMFTLLDRDLLPMIEIRREPYSLKSEGGIFPKGACHLRLSNRYCYEPNPVSFLLKFLDKFGYQLISTSRLDIALDFVHFDCNQNPAIFLRDYFACKYAKINQCKFQTHGKDAWSEKTFNSCKWGSEYSKITTKLYNKSMELQRDGHDKPYIRRAWQLAELPDNRDVWRIEFSMKSECKSLVRATEIDTVDTDTGELAKGVGEHVIDISLWNILDPSDWRALFFCLADRYFDFRYVEFTKSGKPKRKDRCRRVPLFRLNAIEQGYSFKRLDVQPFPGRKEKMMLKYLREIAADRDTWGRDAELAANALDDVFISRYQFAVTKRPLDDIYLNPDKQPIVEVRHDAMTDEQYQDYLQKTRAYYEEAVTNFIKRSPTYKKIRQKIEDEFRQRKMEEDLPF